MASFGYDANGTVNNNACDTLGWPASTATTRLENLAPGAHGWPFDLMEPWALRAALR